MVEEDFERELRGRVVIEKVNMLRATSKEAGILKDRLLENSLRGYKRIIVDLSRSSFVDSSVIGAMVLFMKRFREKDGEIRVVIGNPEVFQIFTLSGLYKSFSIYRTVDEALNGFKE